MEICNEQTSNVELQITTRDSSGSDSKCSNLVETQKHTIFVACEEVSQS